MITERLAGLVDRADRTLAAVPSALPLLALRGISDGAEELSHVDDWRQYLHIIDEKLAAAIDLIEAAIL